MYISLVDCYTTIHFYLFVILYAYLDCKLNYRNRDQIC